MKWYVDISFTTHPDFKSHTGGVMIYGCGVSISVSKKQKLNTRSMESELVGADDMTIMILWMKLFLEEQGYEISRNILYQDNKSAILLQKSGKQRSSSQRTRAIRVRSCAGGVAVSFMALTLGRLRSPCLTDLAGLRSAWKLGVLVVDCQSKRQW